jgi:stage 0 sporulation regulatory protein
LYQKNKNLLEAINEQKSKLYDTVEKNGLKLTDEATLKQSQELDQLIFQYQKAVIKSRQSRKGKKSAFRSMMVLLSNVLAEV